MSQMITLYQGETGFELPVEGEKNWVMLRQKGYSPIQSLVAAVGSCGGYVFQELLKNSNVPYTFERVEATYEQQQEGVKSISKINLVFYVSVEETYQDKAQSCLRLVSRYCPVIQSLDKNITIIEHVKFI